MRVFKDGGCECVWSDGETDVNQYVDFLRVFDLERECPKAELYLSVDTEYAVFINGEFADCGQYDDYPEHKAYDALDVGNYLKVGENRLCVRAYYQGENSMQYVAGTPMLVFLLSAGERRIVSGEDTLCRSAPDYVSGGMDKFTMQLSFSFVYDASKRDDGWMRPGARLTPEWKSARANRGLVSQIVFYRRPVKKLVYRKPLEMTLLSQGRFIAEDDKIKPLGLRMSRDYLSYRDPNEVFSNWTPDPPYQSRAAGFPGELRLREGLDGVYLALDMGAEEAGLFYLHLDAGEGTRVDVCYGEHMDDMRVRSYIDGRSFAFTYICGRGEQRFTHYFKRIGGRYIQLHISRISAPLTVYYAGIIPTDYPLRRAGGLVCSDRLMNRILDVCDRTLRLCMHEHYEDSPWREQALYSMDSRNQMLAGYYMYDNGDYVLANLKLLAEHAREDGLLQNASPSLYPVTMPSFSLEWILSLRDYVLFTGDTHGARPLLSAADGVIDAVWKYYDGKLLATPDEASIWNFYEWVSGLDDFDGLSQNRKYTPQYDAPLNALFCLALKAREELAGWYDADTTRYREMYELIRARFFDCFWLAEHGAIASYLDHENGYHFAELTQAWALLAGLVPVEYENAVRERLCDLDESLTKSTLSFCVFRYQALLQDKEKYAREVFEEIARRWGGMLFKGCTSFWETIAGADDFERAGSLCHGWTAIPAYFLYAYALGVTPLTPGFKTYRVEPAILDMNLRGSVKTPHGEISVRVHNGKCEAARNE